MWIILIVNQFTICLVCNLPSNRMSYSERNPFPLLFSTSLLCKLDALKATRDGIYFFFFFTKRQRAQEVTNPAEFFKGGKRKNIHFSGNPSIGDPEQGFKISYLCLHPQIPLL